MDDVVITGIGAVSPLGWGAEALWEGLLDGRSGLGPVSRFDATGIRSAGAGEVPEGSGEGADGLAPSVSLAEKYLLFAVHEAVDDAGVPREGTALVVATNFGGMSRAEESLAGGGTGDLTGYEFRTQAERVGERLGLTGVCLALSHSCASGVAAVIVARDLIRTGRAERAVAAGYDELSRYAYAGLAALRATSPSALRPFDKKRDGALFSEGAGALVIERAGEATRGGPVGSTTSSGRRGRKGYAVVAGGALNNDGYHMTAPDKEARGVKALMRAALADARVSAGEIDHVNLHGTGTKYNDLNETIAMKDVFGERARAIPVTANKSALGHAMGAAGALEMIASVLTIRDGRIPPTIGIEEQDPECDLDVVRDAPREVPVRCVLKTSYGIGGTNAAVVLVRLD